MSDDTTASELLKEARELCDRASIVLCQIHNLPPDLEAMLRERVITFRASDGRDLALRVEQLRAALAKVRDTVVTR